MGFKRNEKLDAILRASGSTNPQEHERGMAEVVKALELPLRDGILSGDITNNIFEPVDAIVNTTMMWPLSFVAPGTESDYVAFTMPNEGYIPQKQVEGDFVQIPTYDIAGSIDWLLKYARDAGWNIVGKAMQNFQDQFTKKINDDSWHVLLSAGVDRNIIVLDSDAAQGQFTKRLVSLGKTVMRRNGGGNSTSQGRGRLTDMYLSPEAMEDIRNWNVDQIDEVTRREIFIAPDSTAINLFSVNLHDLDELGEGQEYELFFENTLGGTLPTAGGHQDVEIAVGLDLSNRDSFIMPIKEELSVFEDPELHRQRRAGVYGTMEFGLASLDSRRTLLLSM